MPAKRQPSSSLKRWAQSLFVADAPVNCYGKLLYPGISSIFAAQECIFRRMINDKFIEHQYNGKALLVTACGFPDVQTRMLLSRLSQECPHLPIYGIADFDPYGDGPVCVWGGPGHVC